VSSAASRDGKPLSLRSEFMPAEDVTPHEISLAVWDLPSPLVVGRSAKMKVGAKCSAGCPLTGQDVEIHNKTEVSGRGTLGPTPWPGTSALYWAEVDLDAPAAEGTHCWEVALTASARESAHERTSSSFGFIAVPPPELCLIVKVTEKKTDVPVRDVEVRLGPHRGSTDDLGSAKVELPKGAYDLVVWKLGYRALEKAVEVMADTTVQAEIELEPEPEQEYWMG